MLFTYVWVRYFWHETGGKVGERWSLVCRKWLCLQYVLCVCSCTLPHGTDWVGAQVEWEWVTVQVCSSLGLIYTWLLYVRASTSKSLCLCEWLCLRVCNRAQGIQDSCSVLPSSVGCTWAPLLTNQILSIQIRCPISGGTAVELDAYTHANIQT